MNDQLQKIKIIWEEYKLMPSTAYHKYGCACEVHGGVCNCGVTRENHLKAEKYKELRNLLDSIS